MRTSDGGCAHQLCRWGGGVLIGLVALCKIGLVLLWVLQWHMHCNAGMSRIKRTIGMLGSIQWLWAPCAVRAMSACFNPHAVNRFNRRCLMQGVQYD